MWKSFADSSKYGDIRGYPTGGRRNMRESIKEQIFTYAKPYTAALKNTRPLHREEWKRQLLPFSHLTDADTTWPGVITVRAPVYTRLIHSAHPSPTCNSRQFTEWRPTLQDENSSVWQKCCRTYYGNYLYKYKPRPGYLKRFKIKCQSWTFTLSTRKIAGSYRDICWRCSSRMLICREPYTN